MSRFAPFSRGRQAARQLIIALSLAAGAAGLAAAPAAAGNYTVFVCKDPAGNGIPLDDAWTPSVSQSYSSAGENCGIGATFGLLMGGAGAPAFYGPGPAASWRYSGAGNTIESATVRRVVSTWRSDRDAAAIPEYRALAGAGNNNNASVVESCAAWDCQLGNYYRGDDPSNDVSLPLPSGTMNLEFLTHCGGDPAGGCANNGVARVSAAFYRMELVLKDPSVPVVIAGSVKGTLDTTADQAGSRSLSFAARDYGSGIFSAVVSIDGRDKVYPSPDTNGGQCVDADFRSGPDFRMTRPCAVWREVSFELKVDTVPLSDGKHTVQVRVYDASGNSEKVFEKEITVENVPAPKNLVKPTILGLVEKQRPDDPLTVSKGLWENAEGPGVFSYQWQKRVDGGEWSDIAGAIKPGYQVALGDVDSFLRVVVTATTSQGSVAVPTAPTKKIEPGDVVVSGNPKPPFADPPSGGNPSTAQLVVDREQRTVDVKHGAKIVITGRLVDADGQPIADAEVDVFEQLVLTAAPWHKIGTVKTDSQGGYVFRPRTTASRRLRFAFADRRDAASYRATREVLVSVEAGMSITARRHVVSRRGVIRIRGRVTVDGLPKTGTWVEVQVLDAGVWRTVATRRTSSRGLWTFNHRLRQSAGVTFKFRSRLRVVGDVASAEAKSAPVRVRIR